MMKRPPTNLNQQSQEATVLLIREVLARGIQLTEVCTHVSAFIIRMIIKFPQVYVDALGTTTTYERYLSGLFPGIAFTVATKADSKFKIVGAASVAAKVTRDACIESWCFEENIVNDKLEWAKNFGSGYPSGKYFCWLSHRASANIRVDPNTQAWLKGNIEPTFGFPKIVRFSWTTVKVLLEKHAHPVKW